jgi:DNA-binding GntR family transcriptional regulator
MSRTSVEAPKPRESIKRQTVTSSVADVVRRRIIDGTYGSGFQLRQDSLATELGVSRIPIREALLQLEAEGLVEIHTHKGALVSALSVSDAQDLFDARAALEPMIARIAVRNATPKEIDKISACLKDYREAIERQASPEEISHLNWQFHRAMCEPANRPRSMQILGALHSSTDRYLGMQINLRGAANKALIDHETLLDAFVRRDEEMLIDNLMEHIRSAESSVIRALQNELL